MVYSGILSLRRRSVWEAADAGLLLWRRNLGYFIPLFAIPFWICAFALLFLSSAQFRFTLPWAWCILWWLNPLFDRFILHVVGLRFFEPQSGLRQLFRGLGKSLSRGLVGDLLWRRFSPWRAAVLPLRVLESPPPAQLKNRKRALSNGGLHFCIFLSIWCFTLQWILLAGEALFVLMISRLFFDVEIWGISQLFTGKGIYYFTAWCVNYLVVESLYVCMGFGLYLNSRVDVEGWDLELMFRGFAERRKKSALAVLLLIFLSVGLLCPAGAWGEETGFEADVVIAEGTTLGVPLPPEAGANAPREDLEKILDREMGGEKKTWGIRFKNENDDAESLLADFDAAPWITFLQKAGAFALRVVMVLAIGALAAFCGVYAYRSYRRSGGARSKDGNAVVSTLPLSAAPPPPEQLLEEAGRLYREGQRREAWGLCYAAALGTFTRYRGIRFPPGATEYRCLSMVKGRTAPRDNAGFSDLIGHWIAFAYGGQVPPDSAFEEAHVWVSALCGSGEVHE